MGEHVPDLAALYLQHRDAMHRVAASVLGVDLAHQTSDAVQDAIVSILHSPPKKTVRNWEAFLVTAAKRKALDRVGSAATKHAGPELTDQHDHFDPTDMAEQVAETLDRQQRARRAHKALAVLDERHRKVAWEYVALERPREQVAAELGVTPARVSQMAKAALSQLRDAMDREEVKK